jgi:D-serine deaminase-like pyridoxal phosphate-dependent protein
MDSPLAQAVLPAQAHSLESLNTPRPVVFEERLAANIRRMADRAGQSGVALRPHAKTHKCVRIAEMQTAAGAVGLTVAKPGEALAFMGAGVHSLTVAYPLIDPGRTAHLLAEARRVGAEIRLMADSETGVAAIAQAARDSGVAVSVYIKIDVGLRRCGLQPDDPHLPVLARMIINSKEIGLAGILSHAGHAYGAGDIEGVKQIAAQELSLMAMAKARIEDQGIAVPSVSVGSTPTVIAAKDMQGVTEIRPGNYVFFDLTQQRLGVCGLDDLALFIMADVVSVNADYAIVNAGSKSLSSDAGAHGTGGKGFGLAFPVDGGEAFPVLKLSEEHGFLERAGRDVSVGQRVFIAPNHACAVANLFDALTVVDAAGSVSEWRVTARGRVR